VKKLLKRLIVSEHKYNIATLVRIGTGSEIFEIAARYYNENLNIVYILRTQDNKLIAESEEFIVEYKGSI